MDSLFGPRFKLFFGIASALAALCFLYVVRGILAPFVMAFILAYVLTPVVDAMEGRGLKRTPSILFIFAALLAVLTVAVITAGRRMTEQVMDLSREFLRQESSHRELVITNRGNRAWPVVGVTTSKGDDNPFFIVEPIDGRTILEPGQDRVFRLLFAPREVKPFEGTLTLQLGGALEAVPLAIPLSGNAEVINDKVWVRRMEPFDWGKLTLSAGGLDFGMAGPNVVTLFSARARELQPRLQPYLGPNTDLAAIVKTYGNNLTEVLLGRTSQLLSGLFSGIMLLVVVPFVAFFFLKEGRRITHGIIELVPNAYFELTLNLFHQINNQIGGYIRGQLLAVAIVAGISAVGLLLIDMPYALPLGVVAGFANMIPYLGPLIGIISASVVALTTSGSLALVTKVVILFLAIQVIDNIFIQPLIVAKSVDLHPLVVLVVVMIGSDLGGIVGMLVAVPVTGILKVSGQTVYAGIKSYRVT